MVVAHHGFVLKCPGRQNYRAVLLMLPELIRDMSQYQMALRWPILICFYYSFGTPLRCREENSKARLRRHDDRQRCSGFCAIHVMRAGEGMGFLMRDNFSRCVARRSADRRREISRRRRRR